MRHLIFAAVLSLAGCSAPSLTLDASYAPLTRVEQDPTKMIIASSVVTTADNVVWVHDLTKWEFNNPAGPFRDAVLQHERAHAIRQNAMGPIWYARYLTEPSFRWAEEQVGWAIQLKCLTAAVQGFDVNATAAFLSGSAYTILGVPMVSNADALAWIHSLGY